MRGLLGGSRLLAALLRTPRVPRAPHSSKPPEHPLSAAEQAIAFSVMSVCFLGPTAWVLAHIEYYKSHGE